MLRYFDTLIDPYASDRLDRPPSGLAAFFWHYIRQIKPWLIIVIITSGLLSAISAVLFAYIGILIDRMEIVSHEPALFFAENLGLLLWIAVLVLVIEPLVAVVHHAILNLSVKPSFTALIRWQTHRYVLRQSATFFQNDFAGRLANKVVQTGNALRQTVAEAIEAVWFVIVFVVTAILILADLDIRLAATLLGWVVLYICLLRFSVPRIMRASAGMSDSNSALIGRIVDSYSNIQTVKLFGHAAHEDAYAQSAIEDQRQALKGLTAELAFLDLVIGFMNGVFLVCLAAVAFWLWSLGDLSVGAIAAAFALAMRVSTMSFWMMFVATDIAENVGIVRDGVDTISVPQSVTNRENAAALKITEGAISYDNISFRYGDNNDEERPVIDTLSLSIKPGEKVGLVGRSGAGKSTLVQLLLRFYDIQGGQLTIDGQSVSKVAQDSLRSNIAVVTQDTSLLHRSVLDNICYGLEGAGLEAAIDAAKRAHAHEFILTLSDPEGRTGYDAHVGERGVKLSGGQRQRIAIARALLKDAPILVLDEATSALDSEVEAAIQEQLFTLMEGKTVIAIAHRLSTIAAMDRLVIMDKGVITEQGRHNDLIKRDGLYAQLWSKQSQGFLAQDEEGMTG